MEFVFRVLGAGLGWGSMHCAQMCSLCCVIDFRSALNSGPAELMFAVLSCSCFDHRCGTLITISGGNSSNSGVSRSSSTITMHCCFPLVGSIEELMFPALPPYTMSESPTVQNGVPCSHNPASSS